ncbi:hypothetical protein K435DRAFT_794578 [Dendrothele bispora CBS 962.96]|uniref:Uncharacterized protein n=1 Tax=Dendrothele bispora (strain CBS 962.96) TaxID=1314807 RepID=A0A4S8MBK2_DENBC|nr:hypothetical protein K435DRAFT_794578 [Dendrothele bispora CBS 962.96]
MNNKPVVPSNFERRFLRTVPLNVVVEGWVSQTVLLCPLLQFPTSFGGVGLQYVLSISPFLSAAARFRKTLFVVEAGWLLSDTSVVLKPVLRGDGWKFKSPRTSFVTLLCCLDVPDVFAVVSTELLPVLSKYWKTVWGFLLLFLCVTVNLRCPLAVVISVKSLTTKLPRLLHLTVKHYPPDNISSGLRAAGDHTTRWEVGHNDISKEIRDEMPNQDVVPLENKKTTVQRLQDFMEFVRAVGELCNTAHRCWIAAQRCWVLVNVLIDDKVDTPQLVDGGRNGNGGEAATDT